MQLKGLVSIAIKFIKDWSLMMFKINTFLVKTSEGEESYIC